MRLAALAVVFLWSSLQPRAVAAGDGDVPSEQRTAVLLFLSNQAIPLPPCDLSQVHEGAWDSLTSAARCLGTEVVSRSAMEPLVHRMRVRTGLGIGASFLDSLSTVFACGRLLVVQVAICSDRLLVAGRITTTGDMVTDWAGLAEERLPRALANGETEATAPWVGVINDACRHLLESKEESRAPVATSNLYLLPVRKTGLDDPLADLVSQCLLRSLIGRQWRVQDPGVTFSRLRDAGIDPRQLDARVRPVLTDGTPGVLVVGDVATYEDAGTAAELLGEELSPLSRSLLPSFSVSARWIDGRSGEVTFAATAYVGDGQARGLFGAPRNPSPIRRVQRATDRLVHLANEKG